MEVKVWVEGLPKTICGVSPATTCQDIVYALAHATGKRGRFILFEKWGKTEKPLAPSDILYNLLEEKGEFRHDVQFILRKTETSSSNSQVSNSFSPIPDTAQPAPFQRGVDGKQQGNLRKTLTPHGTDWAPPKIVKTRSSMKTKIPEEIIQEPIPPSVKENNFPNDLRDVLIRTKDVAKESVPGNSDVDHAPVISHKLAPVSAQVVPAKPVPSANGSLEVHINQPVIDMGNHASKTSKQKFEKNAEKEKEARRTQLLMEIRQQNEQLAGSKADCAHFDRELAMWEERTSKIAHEVEAMESQIKLLRESEKAVLEEIEELSKMSLQDMIRTIQQAEKTFNNELSLLQAKVTTCEADILRSRNQARCLHEELQSERQDQDRQRHSAELKIKEERDRLLEELSGLALLQEHQAKRMEDLALNEQRLDSTLIAKQLELDSLEDALKKSNFDGFLECFTVDVPVFSDTAAADVSSRTTQPAVPISDSSTRECPSPAPPVRKSISSQRILVLKRNVARDPQGMWV